MVRMTTRRISFDIEEEEHKNLKSYCAKLGMTIRELVIRAINDKVQKKIIKLSSEKDNKENKR